MTEAVLQIGGQRFQRWTRFELTRSLEQMTPAARFEYSQSDHQRAPVPFDVGLDCQVFVDGQLAVTGYVDDVDVGGDASSTRLVVSVRGRTGDLVDCSAIHKSRQWRESTPLQIARDVCAPFGVEPVAVSDVDLTSQMAKFALEEGETAFELLDRLARKVGALVVEGGEGELVFTRQASGTPPVQLANPSRSILSWSRRSTLRDRHSFYLIKAQHAGSDAFSGDQAGQGFFRSIDGEVGRYRPLVLLAEHSKPADLERRAVWERNRRAGRGQVLTYALRGWADPTGSVWTPNTLVQVDDRPARVKGEFLAVSARLTRDEGGSRTELQLMAPEAFDILREVAPRW